MERGSGVFLGLLEGIGADWVAGVFRRRFVRSFGGGSFAGAFVRSFFSFLSFGFFDCGSFGIFLVFSVSGFGNVDGVLNSFGVGGFFSAVDAIDHAYEEEDDEGDGKEVDNVLEKVAKGDVCGHVSAEKVGDVDRKLGKIETANCETGDRHNNVIDEGVDNGSKSATNGDTDG